MTFRSLRPGEAEAALRFRGLGVDAVVAVFGGARPLREYAIMTVQ